MPERVRLSELATMRPEEFRAAAAELRQASRQAKKSGSPPLDRRIRAFEVRYEMSSDQMLRRLNAGEQNETAEICEWLLLLAARGERAQR